jgi:hypothetical protein
MRSHKLRVWVTVPVPDNDAFVHADVVRWTHYFYGDDRFDVVCETRLGRPLENNLNRTARSFVANDFDFWLSIDSDNPPLLNPLTLAFLDKDVIGCPTPIFKYKPGDSCPKPIVLNAFDRVGDAYREHPEHWGLQEVDAVGGGCFLAARRVLEHPDMQYQPFTRNVDEDGINCLGNDLAFCRRAKAAGFRIWAHYGYQCDHFRRVSLQGMKRGYMEALERKLKEAGALNG